MRDRGADAAQVLNLSVGWSEGLAANVRATKIAQVGFGSYRGIYWTGLKEGVFDVWQEQRSELGISLLYMHEVFRGDGATLLDIQSPLYGDPGFREYAMDVTHDTDRGFFDVGLTGSLVVAGVDVAVRFGELADLVSGFFGVDLMTDDLYAPSDEELLRRMAGDDGRVRSNAAWALQRRHGQDFGYAAYTARGQMPPFQIAALERWREYLEAEGLVEPVQAQP
jgi:hypothetical protein